MVFSCPWQPLVSAAAAAKKRNRRTNTDSRTAKQRQVAVGEIKQPANQAKLDRQTDKQTTCTKAQNRGRLEARSKVKGVACVCV